MGCCTTRMRTYVRMYVRACTVLAARSRGEGNVTQLVCVRTYVCMSVRVQCWPRGQEVRGMLRNLCAYVRMYVRAYTVLSVRSGGER